MATSEARRRANRRNARRSTGPKTPGGKIASRLNARKHGLTAATPVEGSDAAVRGIAALLQADGMPYAPAVTIAEALLQHRQVMDIYGEVYRQEQPERAVPQLRRLDRYLRRSAAQLRRACC